MNIMVSAHMSETLWACSDVSARMCAELARTTFVSLTAVHDPEPGRFRTAADCRHWGENSCRPDGGPLDPERRHAGAAEQNAADEDELIEINRRIAVEELHILDREDRFDQVMINAAAHGPLNTAARAKGQGPGAAGQVQRPYRH